MKKILTGLAGLMVLLNVSFAADKEFAKAHGASFDAFCKVKKWKKGLHTKTDVGYSYYTSLKVAEPVDAKFTISKLDTKGWVVIDARDKGARKASGKIAGALLITSDYNNDAANQFSEAAIIKRFTSKKITKQLAKRSIASVSKKADLANLKYVLFCNGYKCHRSTWGACQLRAQGVPYSNIKIALSGFSGLKEAGAKVK